MESMIPMSSANTNFNPLIQRLLQQQHQLLEDQFLRQSLQEVNP